ncbi:MAG: flavodoxin family protein, partial [Promethearchaeota archaeon]
ASVELFYAKKLNVKPCIGDFQCWFKKVGECIHKDDMQMIYDKLREADILVLATPIYIPLPGEIQNLINRLCPILEPMLEFRDGRTRVRFHSDIKLSKLVLVSSGGWWEKENFEVVVHIAKEIAENGSLEFAGSILRPHSSLLKEDNEKSRAVIKAAKTAGSQLIKTGKISPELFDTISQPLMKEEDYRRELNQYYLKAKEGKA